MNYAVLPPEVNSGRMYAGPGSGPMLAAAQVWDDLAAGLYASAQSYGSVISGLTGAWTGPASVSMSTAAAPYVAWLSHTAEQAERTGIQAKAAASAHAAAHAMTVPPPAIAANRAQLAALVATNFFGQNAPAIAATETQYAQMWAQDAAAMNQYLVDAQAATRLTPFSPPRQNTNPAAAATQSAATSQNSATSAQDSASQLLTIFDSGMSGLGSEVVGLGSQASQTLGIADFANLFNLLKLFLNLFGNIMGMAGLIGAAGGAPAVAAAESAEAALLSTPETASGPGSAVITATTPSQGTISAASGQAASLRSLSIPRAWTVAAPEMSATAKKAPPPHAGMSQGARGPFGHTPLMGGQPMMAMPSRGGNEAQNHHDPEAAKRKAKGRRTTMR